MPTRFNLATTPTRASARYVGAGVMVFLVLLGFNTPESRADLIKYDYSGTITSAAPSSGIEVGTRFLGTFAYDPGKPFGAFGFEGYHDYGFGTAGLGFGGFGVPDSSGLTLAIKGQPTISGQGGLALVMSGDEPFIGYPRGTGTTVTIQSPPLMGPSGLAVTLVLSNPVRDIYPSLAPPTTFDLADFRSATLEVQAINAGRSTVLYSGTIDTLTTPEPSTLIVLVLGAVGWCVRGRARRRTL